MAVDIAIYEAAGALARELRQFWSTRPPKIGNRAVASPEGKLGEAHRCFSVVCKTDRVVVTPIRVGVFSLLLPRVPSSWGRVRVVLVDPHDPAPVVKPRAKRGESKPKQRATETDPRQITFDDLRRDNG